MGGFWPFMLEAYGHFDEFTPARQPEWAAAAGLDREVFSALLADPATREAVVAAKKEGLVNGVEETPTVFLNGRRWVGELELPELTSAIREEAARVKGELCVAD
jgi:protein-disulfide isomerase